MGTGREEKRNGPCGKKRNGSCGPVGWAAGLEAGFSIFLVFSSSFFFKLHSNYLNSNESYALNQIKLCTSMNAQTSLTLEKF